MKTYRVYVAQVNQTWVRVKANDAEEARDKGYSKWRNLEAFSHVISVECEDPEDESTATQAVVSRTAGQVG